MINIFISYTSSPTDVHGAKERYERETLYLRIVDGLRWVVCVDMAPRCTQAGNEQLAADAHTHRRATARSALAMVTLNNSAGASDDR